MINKIIKLYSRKIKGINFENINVNNTFNKNIIFNDETFFLEHLKKEMDIDIIQKFYLDNTKIIKEDSIIQFFMKFMKFNNSNKFDDNIRNLEDLYITNFNYYSIYQHIEVIQVFNTKKNYKEIYIDFYKNLIYNNDIKEYDIYIYLINSMYNIDKLKYKNDIESINKLIFEKDIKIGSIVKNIDLFEVNTMLIKKNEYIYPLEKIIKENWKKLNLEFILRIVKIYEKSNFINLDLNLLEELSIYFWKKIDILDINQLYNIIIFFGKYHSKNINIKSFLDKSIKKIWWNFEQLSLPETNNLLNILTKLEYFEENNINYIYNNVSKYIEQLNEKDLLKFNISHNNILLNKMSNYELNKSLYYKRSLKNISKYNKLYYEFTIPYIESKLNNLTLEMKWNFIILFNEINIKSNKIKKFFFQIGIKELESLISQDLKNFTEIKFKILKELLVNWDKLALGKQNIEHLTRVRDSLKLSSEDLNLLSGLKKSIK